MRRTRRNRKLRIRTKRGGTWPFSDSTPAAPDAPAAPAATSSWASSLTPSWLGNPFKKKDPVTDDLYTPPPAPLPIGGRRRRSRRRR